jgi:spore germination cell wall hydrolase CwlJ-like protein
MHYQTVAESKFKNQLLHTVLASAAALGMSLADIGTIKHAADEVHAQLTSQHASSQTHDEFLELLNRSDISKSDQVLVSVYAYTAIDPSIKHLSSSEKRDVLSMALNVYHEVRGDVADAQYAVAHVTKNRARRNINGSDCYSVVWAPHQFSWTGKNLHAIIPRDRRSWKHAQHVAYQVYTGVHHDNTHGSTNFYAPRPAKDPPAWLDSASSTIQIGQQIFAKLASAIDEKYTRLARLLESVIESDF